MSLNRYACRRDSNEPDLVSSARQIGVLLWQLKKPCDWLSLIHGRFYPVEIKSASGKLTEGQARFRKEVQEGNGELLIWRTFDDVLNDVRRLRGK